MTSCGFMTSVVPNACACHAAIVVLERIRYSQIDPLKGPQWEEAL